MGDAAAPVHMGERSTVPRRCRLEPLKSLGSPMPGQSDIPNPYCRHQHSLSPDFSRASLSWVTRLPRDIDQNRSTATIASANA
jgi:hypothetical protein